MTVVQVRVVPSYLECNACGVQAESLEQMTDRGFHDAHDDDCPIAWDMKVTEVYATRYPEILIEIDGREEYEA